MAGFIRAAAVVITEMGYEAATMSAIAERAGSSIGSLYQFFPNKRAVAEALRAHYMKEIEQSWAALAGEAARLSAPDLARRLVGLQIELVKSHPVLLALLDVAPSPQTVARRALVRHRITAVLMAHKGRLSQASASRTASVVQHISKALLALYAQAGAHEKLAIIEEFKAVLTCYLVPKLTRRRVA